MAAKRKGSDEFFYVDVSGNRQDDALHATMVDDHDGNTRSDLYAISLAVARGVTVKAAADLYAGAGAWAVLRKARLI